MQIYENFWVPLIKLFSLEVSFQSLTGIRGIYIHLMLNAVSWLSGLSFKYNLQSCIEEKGWLVCGSSLRLLYYEIMLDQCLFL